MSEQAFDLTSAEFMRDPIPTFAAMRDVGAVVSIRAPLIGSVRVTTTYDATVEVLRSNQDFVVDPVNAGRKRRAGMPWWIPRTLRAITNTMVGKDEPDHRRLRRLVESAFAKQSVEELSPHIRALADTHLAAVRRSADASSGVADFVAHFSRPYPLDVISELLGLPEQERGDFSRWASRFTRVESGWDIVRLLPAVHKIQRYLRRQFRACRTQHRTGMLCDLVAAEHDGDRLDEEELLAMAFLLLFAGHETTVHLLNIGVLTLLQHPEQKQRLFSDWTLVNGAVDEILRHGSAIQFTKPRYATRDLTVGGQKINRGEAIVPLLAAANCDPSRFREPERFDITRHPNPHVAFGTGVHVCLGLKLAKAEVAIAIKKLFTQYPDVHLAVEPDQLAWRRRIGARVLKELPLRLRPA